MILHYLTRIQLSGLLLVSFFCLSNQQLFAQVFTPGIEYLDATEYVSYIAGNLPIIISAPHGGYLEPDTIPDRDCNGCTYIRDAYTQELARSVAEGFYEVTGCYPHVIINLLHRKKFDANRDIDDAADGHPTVEQSWHNYHAFIDSAKAKIVQDFDRGLFVDLYGHGHDIQRLELGYLLSKNELQLADELLDTEEYIEESSIRRLADDNIEELSHSALLRGDKSLGTIFENKGIPAVPSAFDPFPLDTESYFTGGYNTARHGAREGGDIDGIQIECNQDVRFDTDIRKMFADTIVQTINEYINFHYNNQYLENYCNLVTHLSDENLQSAIKIFPNPTTDFVNITSKLDNINVIIYNFLGQKKGSFLWNGFPIDISDLSGGYYFLVLEKDGWPLTTKVLIKH